MMPLIRNTLISLIISLFTQAAVHAQSPTSRYAEWIVIGIGGAEPQPSVSASLAYNFEPSELAYHVSIEYTGDLAIMGGPYRYYTAGLNVGAGKRQRNEYFQLAEFIGPSLTYRKDTNGEHISRSFSPGLMGNLQFHVKPLAFIVPELGVGIDLFGNLNFAHSYYGVRLALMMNNTL